MEPSYDFIYGSSGQGGRQNQSLRQTLRQSQIGSGPSGGQPSPSLIISSAHHCPDPGTEDLRAQLRTLEYEAAQWKKDREVMLLQHQKELSDAQSRADAEFRRAQTAGGSEKTAAARYEALLREIKEERDQFTSEKTDLERKLRTATGQRDALQEQLDDAQEELQNLDRELNRKIGDLTQRNEGLQKAHSQLREDFESKTQSLQRAQQKCSTQEERIGELEGEMMQLRAASEDAGAVSLLKRELSEQVEHVHKLETELRERTAELAELRQFRLERANVDSELNLLQNKVRTLEESQVEMDRLQQRAQALEDEKKVWAVYLQNQGSAEDDTRIESPEDLARAYMHERVAKSTLENQLGSLQAELTAKAATIQSLEETKGALQSELRKLKGTATNGVYTADALDSKVKARLERQRNLAVKETEFLRAQLKALESDDIEEGDQSQRYAEEAAQRITSLEILLEETKKEVETLNKSIAEAEKNLQQAERQSPLAVTAGTKRALDDEAADERLGQLLRKNRHLQNNMAKLQSQNSILDNEVKAQASQIKMLKHSSRTRILELRDNPTAQAEGIKLRTLNALRSENEALRAQLDGSLPTLGATNGAAASEKLIPRGTLEALELALEERDATIASRDKSLQRLRQVFKAKGGEFVETVYSVLGWKLEFMPNGRVKASSMYYPADKGGEDEGEEHFIMFDGEQGTMKISGGPQSEFAKEIRGLVDFWVDARGSVPGLLAAMTLEFWERYQDGKS
jgi:mitotic spindle assembly checkpoint protein MAD1